MECELYLNKAILKRVSRTTFQKLCDEAGMGCEVG